MIFPKRGRGQNFVSFSKQARKVPLPAGPVGLRFKGTPPQIEHVDDDSPVADKVKVGQVVDKLTIPKAIESMCVTAEDMDHLLSKYSDKEGRSLTVIDDAAGYARAGRLARVTIPKGTDADLGMRFDRARPLVLRVKKESPLAHRLKRGHLVYQFSRVLTTTGETQVLDIINTKTMRQVLDNTKMKRERVLLVESIDMGKYQMAKLQRAVLVLVFFGVLIGAGWYAYKTLQGVEI